MDPAEMALRTVLAHRCPHHDLPLVCGRCGHSNAPEEAHIEWNGHYWKPAHRVNGVLVECGLG